MRLRKLSAALFVVAALGAVLASSALAAAVTQDVKWYTGSGSGTALPETTPATTESMSSSIVGATATFTTHVSGTEYVIDATGINCLNCKIQNSGGTAIGSGELEFTGVTVEKPTGCTTTSTITTKPLSIQADWMKGVGVEPNYIKFEPTAGATTQFATVTVSGCALATSLVPKGTIFVESANMTGTGAIEQEVHSSKAIDTAAGGTLKVGLEEAWLEGSAKFKMTGTHAGQEFQTH